MVKVLALREQFPHMSARSGYDALYSHFPDEVVTDSIFCNFKKIYPRGLGRVLATASKLTGSAGFYNAQSFEAETKLTYKSMNGRHDVIHYTYGESYFGFGGMLKKIKKAAIVTTNHQPLSWWEAHQFLLDKYRSTDAVIVLSSYDEEYFNARIPGKAHCIPHGVDTLFYKPPAEKKAENDTFKVLFAGRYLRDMPTLAAIIKNISSVTSAFSFDILYFDKAKITQPGLLEIMKLPNVHWHSDLSEDAILGLYGQADCLLIPLLDCTANNAILEAMACGVPVIATDLPAIKTYLDDSISVLCRSVDEFCDALKLLSANRQRTEEMALNARKKAVENFDWFKIAATTCDLFKSLS